MRDQRQAGDNRHGSALERPPRAARAPQVAGRSGGPNPLLGLQQTAGNAATVAALHAAGPSTARRRPPQVPPAIEEVDNDALELPSYLRDMEAAGLSTAYGLTGHEFVTTTLADAVGRRDGVVAEIAAELAGRPESFYGRGRAFAVTGARGTDRYDVTVRVSPADDDRPGVFSAAGPDSEGAATKVDVQHHTAAGVAQSTSGSASKGVGFTGFGLAPVAPGVWVGGAATVNAQPFQSSRDSRTQRTMAEPRVLRSDKGSVEVPRRVRFHVRIMKDGERSARNAGGSGALTMRVPVEHLVPTTAGPVPRPRPLAPETARAVSLADSMAPLAVSDRVAPHQGGGGLFDAVASALHPSLTWPGAPGRARLYEATATATVLEDLPRLLRDGVVGEDLTSRDGTTTGTYRMRAAITELTPGWSTGKTQLRTHQQAQHAVTDTAGKGRGGAFGAGPAAGFGVLGNAAAVRGTVMPVAGARKARFSVAEQTVSSRQGAEVRGEKVLYLGTVLFTVEGTGPASPLTRARGGGRTAHHTMRVWVSLRADEARELGLPLPEGVTAGEFVKRPDRAGTDAEGNGKGKGKETDGAARRDGTGNGERAGADGAAEQEARHLPFGAMGSSVAISRLDTAPMMRAVTRLFATDARLAGYLPAFGEEEQPRDLSPEEAEVQRRNYRELVTVLSETNLRVNKDQLLSSGVRVRLRRKSRFHTHDVQLKVTGSLRETGHLGETKDWLVRSHAGVTSNLQSGRASSRTVGGMALGQFRLIPGALTLSARAEKGRTTTRRGLAGPTLRTDVLTNGSEDASVFGGALSLNVDVTMTSRQRKAARALTPGAPGRDAPAAERVGTLPLDAQDVRLLTPTAFTVDGDAKRQLDEASAARGAARPDARTEFAASGIGDLAGLASRQLGGRRGVRDWTLVETVGDGQPVRDLAFELLARAAARNKEAREDRALETEGLAPRIAIEDRFSPQAVTAALRQAVSSGWVVQNLRHARRLAGLTGAVGTRFALTGGRVVHQATGAGTETFVLGGHQVTGQEGTSQHVSVQGGLTGAENGAEWRLAEGVAAGRNLGSGDTTASTLVGTVERNAHTSRKSPLYLVQCDLVVRMVAEVAVTGGGPYVARGGRTVPGAVAVWLTERQLRAAGLKVPGEQGREDAASGSGPARTGTSGKAEAPAGKSGRSGTSDTSSRPAGTARDGTEAESAAATAAVSGGAPKSAPLVPPAPVPDLAESLPLGFGMIEDLPDFVPLLEAVRGRLGASLADELLPRTRLTDRNDNVQRLLRVLDRDGSAGLLSSAMDGGVGVELLDGRKRPYRALFRIRRTGRGSYVETASDGRDMEFITSAAAQRATAHDESDSRGVEAVVAGSGKPDGGAGQLKSLGAAAGLGVGASDSRRSVGVGRAQLGVKTVAEAASAPSARMNVPIEATLEIFSGNRRVALAPLKGLSLTHRVLAADLRALSRLAPVPPQQAGVHAVAAEDAGADRLGPWRDSGVRLPMEAQVNGFRGTPRVRQAVDDAVRRAGGGARFRTGGEAAFHLLREAVSTEWLIAALPLLTAAGVDLPPVHATGASGQDLRASLHARLRGGRVLGVGDKMTFETVAQSGLDAPRPAGADGQQAAEHGRSARGLLGAGVLNADEFRMNQLLGTVDGSGSATATAANAAGSIPLHKPKSESVLVQFTLDVRAVAEVSDRVRAGRRGTAVQEVTLPEPVVVRMPATAVRRMLADATNAGRLRDPEGHLA
ncbi:hypothetical protein J2X68_000790 [Streptomyces sp. 3330]|uniref:hypothetical protein n=1 Tax=Streptomyces sp. 3330 TaxID=2817755 RepID=UPI0028567A94|nr:hypothetical protein [Streptomyces sp. 3330]MDR6974112.1 hypothetical protein [Streptomyces sp. 3330]